MSRKFFKTISFVSVITLTFFLGSTVTTKAMWESLDEEQRQSITSAHLSGTQSGGVTPEHYHHNQPFALINSGIVNRNASHLYEGILALQAIPRHVVVYPPQDSYKKCPICISLVNNLYTNTIVPQRFARMLEENTGLQQRLQETLLEVEELKDDIQRLKAELRAATQQLPQVP